MNYSNRRDTPGLVKRKAGQGLHYQGQIQHQRQVSAHQPTMQDILANLFDWNALFMPQGSFQLNIQLCVI